MQAESARRVEHTSSPRGPFGELEKYLRVLRGARLVDSRKDGQFVFYRLSDEAVASFIVVLRELAEPRLAEMREFSEEFLKRRERLKPVDRRKLLQRMRKGEVLFLDVRAADESRAGPHPGRALRSAGGA